MRDCLTTGVVLRVVLHKGLSYKRDGLQQGGLKWRTVLKRGGLKGLQKGWSLS